MDDVGLVERLLRCVSDVAIDLPDDASCAGLDDLLGRRDRLIRIRGIVLLNKLDRLAEQAAFLLIPKIDCQLDRLGFLVSVLRLTARQGSEEGDGDLLAGGLLGCRPSGCGDPCWSTP